MQIASIVGQATWVGIDARVWGYAAVLAPVLIWYYFSPEFTDVGYRPVQPVPFSHQLHAGQLGMDCRYCHSAVEKSSPSRTPSGSSRASASRPASA